MTHEPLRETYMKRCIDLALQGLGDTAPNPMVGAVIVHNGMVIGEGFHEKFGNPHAEVNALNSVADQSLLKNSIMYVNLEPCSHTGKTPPCADRIIGSGIPQVIAGIIDPNPLVAGKGFGKLRAAGIHVITDVLRDECIDLNRRFITFHVKKRPYIILKWAQTSDNFIDVLRGQPDIQQPTWISNEVSRMVVHKWRSEEQAILVGTRTALMDNPRLNVREWPGKSPVRLVIDRNLKLPKTLNVFDNQSPTIIFNSVLDKQEDQTSYVSINFDGKFLQDMLTFLHEKGIQSVLVEGGRMLLESFIQGNLWDEARVFKGTRKFGAGITAPSIPVVQPEEYFIQEDILMVYYNTSLTTN